MSERLYPSYSARFLGRSKYRLSRTTTTWGPFLRRFVRRIIITMRITCRFNPFLMGNRSTPLSNEVSLFSPTEGVHHDPVFSERIYCHGLRETRELSPGLIGRPRHSSLAKYSTSQSSHRRCSSVSYANDLLAHRRDIVDSTFDHM